MDLSKLHSLWSEHAWIACDAVQRVCADTTHTVVVEGGSATLAADKVFQVNARTSITFRNFKADNFVRFLKAGTATTVSMENCEITGSPDARYFLRLQAPESMAYMKGVTVTEMTNPRMIFYDMAESQMVDEGGNTFLYVLCILPATTCVCMCECHQ